MKLILITMRLGDNAIHVRNNGIDIIEFKVFN